MKLCFFSGNNLISTKPAAISLPIYAWTYVVAFLMIAGTAGVVDAGSKLVWPQPPDAPRIRYVGAVRSARDAGAKDTDAALIKPYGIAVANNGRIYVTDKGKVMFFDSQQGAIGFLGDAPDEGKLSEPIGIAVSRTGRIFVGDSSAGRVLVYGRKGAFVGFIGRPGEFGAPSGIAIDEKRKKIYIVDSKKHHIRVYGLKRFKPLRTIGARGIAGKGTFNFPTNAAVDAKGNLYVVDTGNFRVQVFNAKGRYVRSIGGVGDRPGSFARPKGIAVDSQGHIYVVDAAFQNVQIFDEQGTLLLFFGSGGWGPGYFTLPAGMYIDTRDRLYVVDQWPGTVQIFQYLGAKQQR